MHTMSNGQIVKEISVLGKTSTTISAVTYNIGLGSFALQSEGGVFKSHSHSMEHCICVDPKKSYTIRVAVLQIR